MRKAKYTPPAAPAKHQNFNYQIQKPTMLKDGVYTVNYKKWPEGECFCIATKHTIQLTQHWQPRTVDIIEAEKTLNVGE